MTLGNFQLQWQRQTKRGALSFLTLDVDISSEDIWPEWANRSRFLKQMKKTSVGLFIGCISKSENHNSHVDLFN
jgi:hypothetical protein